MFKLALVTIFYDQTIHFSHFWWLRNPFSPWLMNKSLNLHIIFPFFVHHFWWLNQLLTSEPPLDLVGAFLSKPGLWVIIPRTVSLLTQSCYTGQLRLRLRGTRRIFRMVVKSSFLKSGAGAVTFLCAKTSESLVTVRGCLFCVPKNPFNMVSTGFHEISWDFMGIQI